MEPAHLALDNLTIRYQRADLPAIEDLSLEAHPGELLALLGPSGSGKSTTLRCIAGFLDPECGDVRLDGRSILALPPERRNAAFVFQQPTLFPHLSVAENVAFGLRMRGVGKAERMRRVEAALAAVQLADLGTRRPHQISGGQRQRVALARALITQPRLLLLDEPFSALDPELRDEMRALVRELQRGQAVTAVLVTHDQQEASMLADRIALLIEGRLQQIGPPDVFYRRPANLAVARFFGAQNFLAGTLDRDERTAFTSLGSLMLHHNSVAPGPVTLVIRPERVRLSPPDATPNGIAGRVQTHQFLGALHRYVVACARSGDMSSASAALNRTKITSNPEPVYLTVLTTDANYRAGDAVRVILPPEHIWALADHGDDHLADQ